MEHIFPPEPGTPDDTSIELWYVTAPFPHAIDGHYVERFWLPVLGPTAIVLLRRIATDQTARPPQAGHITTLALEPLAQSLGLGAGTAKVGRTLDRLVRFGIIHDDGAGRFTIADHLPDVPDRHQRRWPDQLRAEHLGAQIVEAVQR